MIKGAAIERPFSPMLRYRAAGICSIRFEERSVVRQALAFSYDNDRRNPHRPICLAGSLE